jgi:hypothetical protein
MTEVPEKVSFLYDEKTYSFAIAEYSWEFWRKKSFREKFTYSGTLWHLSWSRVLLEKLILDQLITKLPAFYETQMVTITFTGSHNWTPIYAWSIRTTTLLAVPQVESDFFCQQVIQRSFNLPSETLNTFLVFLHILHVVSSSYLLQLQELWMDIFIKCCHTKKKKRKWKGKMKFLRNRGNKRTTEIWVKEITRKA